MIFGAAAVMISFADRWSQLLSLALRFFTCEISALDKVLPKFLDSSQISDFIDSCVSIEKKTFKGRILFVKKIKEIYLTDLAINAID